MLTAACLALAAGLASPVAVDPPAPFGAIPSDAQLQWHELEFYGFIHFSPNTFTDKEWGYGDEPPAIFNPSELNCNQWAMVAREAGMRGLILTAKHHDGFCLWPSEFTGHSVKASPLRSLTPLGQPPRAPDVVREFANACRQQGLQVGLYLSPWDRNHPSYGKPEYVEYYRNQWTELINSYGPLFEVWVDGANGGDGYYGGARETRTIDRQAYYGWDQTFKEILDLAPRAIIFSDAGPGCRWVGNESGHSAETSWQTLNLAGHFPGGPGSENLALGDKGGTDWVGVECDVSIRPGWFYHATEDSKVKSADELERIWYDSVGRGANLLLNVPPDQRGLIHDRDVAALRELRRRLNATFAVDLARGSRVAASSIRGGDARYGAAMAVDGDASTYWATGDSEHTGELVIDLPGGTEFNVFKIREFIALGQRVESFEVDRWDGAAWQPLCRGTTIGPRRILRFPTVSAERVRMRITGSMASPLISEVSLFRQPG